MIQIDELAALRDIAHDIEFADGLLLGRPERSFGGRVTFGIKRIFRPLPCRGQIFESVVVFDENVHSGYFICLIWISFYPLPL